MDHYQYDPQTGKDNGDNNNSEHNIQHNNKNRNNRPARKIDGLAIAALICSFIAITFIFFGVVAVASILCGAIALPGIMTIWGAIIFSTAAIILSILSRINNGKYSILGAVGLTLGIVFLFISLMEFTIYLQVLNNPDIFSEIKNEIYEYYQNIESSDGI